MPSPFPGMDPYLEHTEFFSDLHDSLIIYLREALQPRLPKPYYVRVRSRVWVEYTNRVIEPDVNLLRANQPAAAPPGNGGTVGAVVVALREVPVPNDETREPFLEIHTVQGDRQLVTAIEVLSLSNKKPNSEGRKLYLDKQRELLNSQVNLVEIDLLRSGEHTTAVPHEDATAAAGPFDYHVCVRCMDALQQRYVYPIRLEQRLPEVVLPLLPGEAGVPIDLQAVFDRCYDTGGYDRLIPYADHPLDPPLTPDRADWALHVLREKGILPS